MCCEDSAADNKTPPSIETLTCLICNKDGFVNLTGHILHFHKMKMDEYRKHTGYEGRMVTRNQAVKMALLSNAKWGSERKARLSKAVKDSYTDDLKKKRSDDTRAQWSDSEQRQKKIEGIKNSITEEVTLQRVAEFTKTMEKRQTPLVRLRKELYLRAGSKCENCGISEEDALEKGGRRLNLHHENYDRLVPNLEDVVLLCQTCHHVLHGDGRNRERFPMVSRAVGDLLKALGVDLLDENFIETPRRVASYLLDCFRDPEDAETLFEDLRQSSFPSEYQGMVAQTGITLYGICPHHLLPVLYKVSLAYIPKDRVIGLSKLARLAKFCAKLPILQETLTAMIADSLEYVLETPDVAVTLEGTHLCMVIRGVEQSIDTTTSSSEMRGLFKDNSGGCKSEFFQIVRKAVL